MNIIKLFLRLVVVLQIFVCSLLWLLPKDALYILYLLNSIFIIVSGSLMIKYIKRSNEGSTSEDVSPTLLDLSLDGIYIENNRGEILECNPSGHEMFGYTKEEMLNLTIRDLVPEEFAKELPEIIPDNMATGDVYVERVNRKKDGEIFPTEINSKYIYIDGKKRLIVFVRDISTRKKMEDELKEMSRRDELTKVYNRRYIMKKLEDEIIRSKLENCPLSIALLDIDNFKKVNDTFGHLFGDEVLIRFSNVIRKNLRKTDYLGRIGGEEFIIIFSNAVLDDGYNILFRVKEKMNSIFWEKEKLSVTFSAGLFEVDHGEEEYSCKNVIKLIDNLMYRAKKCGKNCIITPSDGSLEGS